MSSGSSFDESLFSATPLTPDEYEARLGLASPAGAWTTTKVLNTVGAFLAKKIVAMAGSQAFAAVFEAITDERASAVGMLEQIGQRIDALDASLREINSQLQGLLLGMDEFRNEMESGLREGALARAISAIDTYLGTSPSLPASAAGVQPPTFNSLVSVYPKEKTPAELKLLRDAFMGAEEQRRLTTHIQAIHNALTEPLGQSKPLLILWTDGLLLQISRNKMSRENAYYALEHWFLQAVSKEVSGATMRCFELAVKDRVDRFLEKEFGPKLRRQTAMFILCVERLMLEGVRLPKVPCLVHAEQVKELPPQMESVFLRADLICAALNLVLNEQESPTLRDAVAGIYGRVLARPIDVANGQPAVSLPDYPSNTGIPESKYEFTALNPIQLEWDGNIMQLAAREHSHVFVIRYFWRWPTPLPPQNVPIDSRMRGGVKPAYFDVFNNNDWPMAAGFVDFRSLLVGAPKDAQNRKISSTGFRNPPSPANLKEEPYSAQTSHFLTAPSHSRASFELDYYQGYDFYSGKNDVHYLFTYSGDRPGRLRVTLDVFCRVAHEIINSKDKYYTTAMVGVNAKASIREHQAKESTTIFNSSSADNGILKLELRVPGYRASLDHSFQAEFDVRNGAYLMDFEFIYGGHGYQFDGLKVVFIEFILKGVYLEWV